MAANPPREPAAPHGLPDAPRPTGPDLLADWVAAVRSALDIPEVDTAALLDLARDVAHGVARPAAPVTCFLVGLAAGRAAGPAGPAAATTAAVAEASAVVAALLAGRGEPVDDHGPGHGG